MSNVKSPNALTSSYDACKRTACNLLKRTKHRPTIGMVIGSGLSDLVNMIDEPNVINYKDIEGFPFPTAHGHKGRLVFGKLTGKTVVCMQGRVHGFEGCHPAECAFAIRVMKLLGVETLLLASSAGALNDDFKNGDIMIITDHICLPALTGLNPLTGPNDERFGVRFPDMANCYSSSYIDLVKYSAARLNLGWRFRQGIYVMIGGPAYSTNAERRFLRACGGDAVGMGTCWEVMAARHCGMKVLALCVIAETFNHNWSIDSNRSHNMDDIKNYVVSDLTRLLLETIPTL